MATPKKTDAPRKYHVVLTDGTERTIAASHVRSHDGALSLLDGDGDERIAFAPGTWKYVELETVDD
jgi:hypothetical protein